MPNETKKCQRHCCEQECVATVPGHFIGANDCRFFKHDGVGPICISTVGDYRPFGSESMETIGFNRYFETYVFDKHRESGRWQEIDSDSHQTEAEATAGHVAMVAKYTPHDGG